MPERSFKRLIAYAKAVEMADELREQIERWSSFDRWSLGLQLMRAADSIGANIAEAMGRWHYNDQRRMLYIARGSLFETEHWIERADARGLLDAKSFEPRIDEARKTLNGLISRRQRLRQPPLIPQT